MDKNGNFFVSQDINDFNSDFITEVNENKTVFESNIKTSLTPVESNYINMKNRRKFQYYDENE